MLIRNYYRRLEGEPGSILGAGQTLVEPVVEPGGDPVAPEIISEGWMQGVAKDLADDPIMKAVGDVPTLVKNYVHAQRQMGKKGFILPTSNDDGDKWRELYTQLGGPGQEEYKYDTPENTPLDKEFLTKFNQVAYDNNVLPHQAKSIIDFYMTEMNNEEIKFNEQAQAELNESLENLKKEWGEGFDKKVSQAQSVISTFGNDALRDYLNESGLGNDPNLVKLFANIGENLKEDTFKSEAVGHLGLTPEEAQEKINITMGDASSPYHNEMHANHKNAVKEMQKWFEVIHGR